MQADPLVIYDDRRKDDYELLVELARGAERNDERASPDADERNERE